jgi:hypothetical protein
MQKLKNAKTNSNRYSGRKRGRPRKRRRDESEEGLNVMGIRSMHAMARDRREWRKIVLEAKVQNGL